MVLCVIMSPYTGIFTIFWGRGIENCLTKTCNFLLSWVTLVSSVVTFDSLQCFSVLFLFFPESWLLMAQTLNLKFHFWPDRTCTLTGHLIRDTLLVTSNCFVFRAANFSWHTFKNIRFWPILRYGPLQLLQICWLHPLCESSVPPCTKSALLE